MFSTEIKSSSDLKDDNKPAEKKLKITVQTFPKRLPRELRLKHLGANGKFVSDEESKKIQERLRALGKKNCIVSRDELGSTFDVLVTDDPDNHYIIYQNPNADSKQHDSDSEDEFGEPLEHTLGSGTFGEVSICQHSITKKLYALKNAKRDEDAENEFRMLKKAGVGLLQILTEKQAITLMELAPGVNLADYLDAHSQQSEAEHHPLQDYHYLQIILGMLRCIQPLHQSNLVHLDIKLLNFKIQPISRTLNIVDFGCAVEVEDDKAINHDEVGTPGHTAPEVKEGQVRKASDIYSLGITIAMMLGMITEDTINLNEHKLRRRFYQLLDPEVKDLKNTTQIQETARCKKILAILHRMTKTNPEERPTIEECIKFFEELELEHQKNNVVKVGIVNLDDLIKPKDSSRVVKSNISSLIDDIETRHCDEVWFIDVNGHFSDKQKEQVERRLRNRGIFVADKIFTAPGASIADVIKEIPNELAKLDDQRKYFGLHVKDMHTVTQVDLTRRPKPIPCSMFSSPKIQRNVHEIIVKNNLMNLQLG
jgi:serine/threonine protein kinase